MTQGALVAVDTTDPIAFYRQMTTCWENGDAVLPVDHRLSRAGARALIDRFKPAYFIDQRRVIGLAGGVPVSPGIALVVATSGTTGEPKGVELTHANLAASAYATARWLGTGPEDRWCCCLPLAHIAGISTLTRSIMADAEPEFTTFGVDEILRTKATCISLVATMLARLIEAEVDLTRFRVILVGGGPTPRSLIEIAQRSGARVVATYGMTETTGGCVYDGNALPGVDIEIGAHGVIRLHGPMVMSGYRLDEMGTERSLQDGWFETSDLGSLDSGKLTVLGRR
ncbi:MAG TPA: AMP-binding protein, partial [Actinomycetota bacterium]|nr:AMP-binding protein [Actinomycetota bacterium]